MISVKMPNCNLEIAVPGFRQAQNLLPVSMKDIQVGRRIRIHACRSQQHDPYRKTKSSYLQAALPHDATANTEPDRDLAAADRSS